MSLPWFYFHQATQEFSKLLFSFSNKILVTVPWLISLPLYRTGQCGCIRAATALNLLAVFISSENRHISTTLIVSHFNFSITLQGLSIIHFLNGAAEERQKLKRSNRSKANEELKNNIVTVSKVVCEKGRKSLRKTQKIFRFHCAQNSHTRTWSFVSFPFVSVSVTLSRFPFLFVLELRCDFSPDNREKNASRGELNLEIAKLYGDLFWIYQEFIKILRRRTKTI